MFKNLDFAPGKITYDDFDVNDWIQEDEDN